ncbi:hypothetical protein [Ralstonia mannitolilytica]|uniref:hypothetical protein n=1 Tax=Ralstonia mannitolilytica TaxID=105219 RepID=UPI0012FDB49E|nr:hypothetical protein [Ralstonia mannitolilytica]
MNLARTARCCRGESGYGKLRLSESVVVENVTAIRMQMPHEVAFQACDDCGDGFDENDKQQADDWFVHGVSLVVNVDG